jgi:hypothetical protein
MFKCCHRPQHLARYLLPTGNPHRPRSYIHNIIKWWCALLIVLIHQPPEWLLNHIFAWCSHLNIFGIYFNSFLMYTSLVAFWKKLSINLWATNALWVYLHHQRHKIEWTLEIFSLVFAFLLHKWAHSIFIDFNQFFVHDSTSGILVITQ